MADVALDPDNSNALQLFGQGVRAYVLQDYETAVKALSKASELLATEHGDELHDSLGDVYLYYGKSLLELSRKEGGPLGDAVLKSVDEEDEEGEDDEEEEEGKVESDNAQDLSKSAEEATSSKTSEDQPADPPAEEESTQEQPQEEELTDLQVAWEVLELAKQIFAKRTENGEKFLAETLIVLGEISLESGNFESAIQDITDGLTIQQKLLGDDSRTVAETLYKLGTALSTNAQIDAAIDRFNQANQYINNRIKKLKTSDEKKAQDEAKELEELLPEIDEKISDMKSLKEEMAKKAEELKNGQNGSMSTNGTKAASSDEKKPTNISHLVKRKRKPEEEDGAAKEANPVKKFSP